MVEDEFLTKIVENLQDFQTRLVYSDYLEENGQILEAQAWRWLTENEKLPHFVNLNQIREFTYLDKWSGWVWFRDEKNNGCGYVKIIKKYGNKEQCSLPCDVFDLLEGWKNEEEDKNTKGTEELPEFFEKKIKSA